MACRDLNLEATELRLGLPGRVSDEFEKLQSIGVTKTNKRSLPDINQDSSKELSKNGDQERFPPSKAQVVGWPPIRSYRKNHLQAKKTETDHRLGSAIYVKVSMDGAPYLRKIDLKLYEGYSQLLSALQDMFKFKVGDYSERDRYDGSKFVPTYEDKDGDWMLVGDVPWNMFINSCTRLIIMKGSEAKGLGCSS